MDDNRRYSSIIEFIVFDAQPSDGIRNWIQTEFSDDLNTGYLRYFSWATDMNCNIQTVKNTTCFCSTKEIVSDLGCGDFTGYLGGQYIINLFLKRPKILLRQIKHKHEMGSERISIRREYFDLMGGYDEQFLIADGYVEDLIARLKLADILCVQVFEQKYTQSLEIKKSLSAEIEYIHLLNESSKLSKKKISEGQWVANHGIYGLRSHIFNHKGEKI